MKQTAVEYLIDQLDFELELYNSQWVKLEQTFEKAKEMEKKQMCDFAVGFMMQDRLVISYWDEQFKKK
jgi:hypothetical protein